MAATDTDILAEAIKDTEKELFAEAFGKEEHTHDESGDTSREEMVDEFEEVDDESEAKDESGEKADVDAKSEKTDGDDEASETDEGDGKQPRDEKTGRFAAKDEKDEGDKSKFDASDKAAKADADDEAKGRVPPGRLREQTERAKAAEQRAEAAEKRATEAEAAAKKEVDALNAKLDGILAAMQRQQQPQQPKPKAEEAKVPDLFEDPKGFVDHLQQGFRSELERRDHALETMRIETSMQIAASRHGDNFAKAYEAVGKLDRNNPDDQMTVRRIWNSPNPGEALVTWHRNQETLREVGSDPAKYKEKIAAETRDALMRDPDFRKQLIENLQAEAQGADGKPRSVIKIPPKLNGASGARSAHHDDNAVIDDSDRSLFEGAFAR